MRFRNPFRKPEPVVVDPIDRLKAAVDEANAALAEVRQSGEKLRFWTSSTPGSTLKNSLSFGYWDGYDRSFVSIYPE